jgi:ATP-binding cassette subfamily B multidrug efflux pump
MKPGAFARRTLVKYAPWYVGGLLALVATNLLSVEIPVQVAAAIDALNGPDPGTAVPPHALVIALMGLGVIAVRTASRVLFFTPGRLAEADMRRDLFAACVRQQPAFLRNYPPGDLISRATSDVTAIRLLIGFGVLQALNTALAVVFTVGQMLRLSPILALTTLIPVAVALVLTQLAMRSLFPVMYKLQAELAALSDHVLSSYQGVSTIHGFGATQAFVERFDAKNDQYRRTTLQRSTLRTAIGPGLALATSIGLFLLILVGGPMAIEGRLTVGELIGWTTLVALLVNPLRGISFVVQIWKQAQVGLERLGAVIDPTPERPDLPNPEPVPDRPPGIEVRGLTFAYPDEPDHEVLHDVSFAIPAGGTLGMLGATGSGKTTLLRCIARLYNPPPGAVLVDGVDVRRLDLDAWRSVMAYVPQRAFLFSETLKDNVLLGAPDDGRLERILAATTLDVDLAQLPQGTLSPVGESGIMLSGGQRQRVALARGLLRPHRLLILDDVLSAVDHRTEHELLASLRARDDHPTTIIAANRISALERCDHVLVLDGGRVVDQGTHGELITRPGPYRDTWEAQSDRTPALESTG